MRQNTVLTLILLISLLTLPMVPSLADETPSERIVFDYSHGQRNTQVLAIDLDLASSLESLGYEVIWARGGLNSSILADAKALIVGAIYGVDNGFQPDEVDAIANWFNGGNRFMWIGCSGDFDGTYINDNMTQVLENVNSRVYPEPSYIEDPISNANADYRAIATGTSSNPRVIATGIGVNSVEMHGGTLLYASSLLNPAPGESPINLEDNFIDSVYPILYYNESAVIVDHDLVLPLAHNESDTGAFVGATMEFELGIDNSSVLVVSGASPYGDYMPMCADSYQGYTLQGNAFVSQTIHLGIQSAHDTTPPAITIEHASLEALSSLEVNASIVDSSEIPGAMLFYAYSTELTSPSNISMTEIAPGIWNAEIPWPGYDTPITFLVSAQDEYGNLGFSMPITILGIEETATTSSVSTTSSVTTTSSPTTPNPTGGFNLSELLPMIAVIGGAVLVLVIIVYVFQKRKS